MGCSTQLRPSSYPDPRISKARTKVSIGNRRIPIVVTSDSQLPVGHRSSSSMYCAVHPVRTPVDALSLWRRRACIPCAWARLLHSWPITGVTLAVDVAETARLLDRDSPRCSRSKTEERKKTWKRRRPLAALHSLSKVGRVNCCAGYNIICDLGRWALGT